MKRLGSKRALHTTLLLTSSFSLLAFAACSGSTANDPSDPTNSSGDSGATGDGSTSNDGSPTTDGSPLQNSDAGLPFTCAETTAHVAPNPCPVVAGTHGHAAFCFRPEWSGATGVDVYLSANGVAGDWSAPFTTLTNDGSGTFTGTATLADGTYPYVFRVHGSADGLVRDGEYLSDQENPQFVPPPTGCPSGRSVSSVTVPQVATPIYHVRGKVVFAGAPQSCYALDLEAGELLKPAGGVLSEHGTANYAESAADGTFDFPVGTGPFQVIVKYPFKLVSPDGGYPDPLAVPSVGVTRSGFTVAASDMMLDPADVAYSESDYAKILPKGGDVALPVTFSYSLVPGSVAAQASVIGTNIAGNDPLYASGFTTATTVTWDGGFASGGVQAGTTYYWGAWQRTAPLEDGGTVWSSESLLFPIQFH
jgi:hypothetical protein